MPQVRATLPERYAITMLWGLGVTALLFMLTTYLLIGILVFGSAPFYITFMLVVVEVLALISGITLGILYHHDRELMRKPQEYRGGELA